MIKSIASLDLIHYTIVEYITFSHSASLSVKLDFCDEITIVVIIKQKRHMPKNVASLLLPIQAKIDKQNHVLKLHIISNAELNEKLNFCKHFF